MKTKGITPKYKVGETIILDGLNYEVIDVGSIYWDGVEHKNSYALWCNEGDYMAEGGYGRIETISYVDKYAQ